MKVALFGQGGMGSLVEAKAREAGHEITVVFTDRDAARPPEEIARSLKGAAVAVDFSVGSAVSDHVRACVLAGVPLVEGTTGWAKELEAVRRIVIDGKGALVHGANFSIGVNLFYRIVRTAAEQLGRDPSYGGGAFIEEAHHIRKKDAPSGTALKLKDIVAKSFGDGISVASTRAGNIPGTHRVGFDGTADQITLTHTARSREGFAAGALLAARWIVGRKGVYEFSEVLDEILGSGRESRG
jgi:4-hydroxy-tetrahydrodipicolinate reductase